MTTAEAVPQPASCPWSQFSPTDGPWDGPNGGQVLIRTLGTRVLVDRGELVRRTTFTLVLRSALTGRLVRFELLRVRVEPAPPRVAGG